MLDGSSISTQCSAINESYLELDRLQMEITFLSDRKKHLDELRKRQFEEILVQELTEQVEELEAMSHVINSLSTQLEIELIRFKGIAVQANKLYQAMQYRSMDQVTDQPEGDQTEKCRRSPRSIWQIHHSGVPQITRQQDGFVVTQKLIDLFTEEEKTESQRRAEHAEKRGKRFLDWLEERWQHSRH